MIIKNLKETSITDIARSITDSFSDYFVKMPSEPSYWENRFKSSRVDYGLSCGLFDQNNLVGFIINGIDTLEGVKTAFNTGTGVTLAARGHKVVDQLYEYIIPGFKENNIRQCALEVIEQNERAIHVYERNGFHIHKKLRCFKGTLSIDKPVTIKEVPFEKIAPVAEKYDPFYSWDNTTSAIKASNGAYKCYEVYDGAGDNVGYFVINPAQGQLIQIESTHNRPGDFELLLSGIRSITATVRINNVDDKRTEVLNAMAAAGLDNFINQYEMRMGI